jgi:chromatin remodeling complex protein RSC6
MPARVQAKSTSSSAPSTAAPAALSAPTTAPTNTDPKKVVRTKKEPVAEAPSTTVSTVVSEPTTNEVTETSTSQTREDRYKSMLASIDAQLASLKTLRSQVVLNFKADSVDLKVAQKSGGRRRRAPAVVDENAPKKAPSGIVKPTNISDEMCSFMGKPAGTQLARTEVTKFITGYIKQHNLQDSVSKRNINPDTKLKSLLAIPDGEVLTYFNLQKYMKVHFPKPATA